MWYDNNAPRKPTEKSKDHQREKRVDHHKKGTYSNGRAMMTVPPPWQRQSSRIRNLGRQRCRVLFLDDDGVPSVSAGKVYRISDDAFEIIDLNADSV